MTLPYLLSVLIFLPLVAGLALMLFATDEDPSFARGAAVAVGVVELLLSLPLLAGGAFQEKFLWIPALGIQYFLRVDGLSVFLILLATFAAPVAMLASWNWVTDKARVYYGAILMLTGGMVGVLASMDLFLFYVFWEIMLIPAFFLVGIFGGARRREATTKFVIYTMVGSLLMLVGIGYVGFTLFATTGTWSFALPDLYALTYAGTGVPGALFATTGHWAFAAFLLAFGIKAALFPFHSWLPDTYGEAPAPVTFLLSAVMAKLGVYGLLRVALPLFPDAARDFAPLLMTLAVIGIVYGALIALVQDDMKRVAAYASFSHMGVILLGVFTLSPQAVSGSVLYMVAHALTTGAVFLLIGFLAERRGTTMIRDYGGIARAVPIYATVFMLVMLGSVGLPGLAGFVGEFLVFFGVFRVSPWAAGIGLLTIILGAAYMLWMYQRVLFGPLEAEPNRRLRDLDAREGLLVALPLSALIIAVGVYPQMFLARINPSVAEYLALMGARGAAQELLAPAPTLAEQAKAPAAADEERGAAAGGTH